LECVCFERERARLCLYEKCISSFPSAPCIFAAAVPRSVDKPLRELLEKLKKKK
jgi:hypothetical protein